ncbi:DUF3387 domain-containing protein [Acinetobacter sp. C_4_1]|nr:DUF3387 domain-containing protein [Acinetobacter sp. F_3_1]MCT8098098.1 DUF3387 domain-containing protein [Acinetobacter sp. C_3_1]MCT8100746.1 DUF3387 domain-containing protein [Acinetobacter sp. C_4_1]MCT8134499.1 DUF3387 domain-containing protein [Acinetobacter sp. T_3_1]
MQNDRYINQGGQFLNAVRGGIFTLPITCSAEDISRPTLQRWKYPPDKSAEAIELVMKQAETLSNAWTSA